MYIPQNKLQTRAKLAYEIIPNNTNNLLDVGCASGYSTIFFKNKARNVYGVDVIKKLIEEGKKKYKNINFKLIKSEKLPFKSDFFDVVTILDVLEHVNKDNLMINEIYRVLKKDGILILSVPNKGLLTFLDADNIKTTMPFLYKILYLSVKRKYPEMKKEVHKHYSLYEIKNLMKNKFEIKKLHIGSSIISTLMSYFEILSLRSFNRIYFESVIVSIKNLDYGINYGKIGDNILIKANKI